MERHFQERRRLEQRIENVSEPYVRDAVRALVEHRAGLTA